MTIPVNDRRIQYTATAGQTIFPYDFKIDANTEITVLQTINATSVTNTLTLTTEYTVSGVGDAGGGNITLVTGASLNDTITIVGNTPLSRVTDFNQAGDFLVSDLNNQLDKITNILQENKTNTDRAVKLKDEDTTSVLEIPTATNRASKFLAFDASGNAIASAGTTGVVVSSFMETVLDDTTAAAARTTLDVEQKASSLTAITTLQDADQFIVADNSDSDNSKKITYANFKTELAATTTTQGISYLNKPVTITNNATDADHDMDFGAGNFDFDDGSGQATLSALTKQFDATFALGTNAGGMVSGESLPVSGFVYVYQISNASGTITDIIGTTTADGSTISGDSVVSANSLTKKKYLCALPTDASNNILAGQYFVDRSGYKFRYKDYILIDTSGYTSRTAISMRVPPNSIVNFLASAGSANATITYTLYTNLSDTDSTPSLNNCSHACNNTFAGFGEFFEITNSSGQIGKKSNNGLTSSNNTRTKGWEEKY